MGLCIALLRGINLGGRNRVAMSGLQGLFADLGFPDAKALLQSGNLVFQSDKRPGSELENLLEIETHKRLQVRADYFVRTSSEWKEIVKNNPFCREAS
jgi:uncharacterized protein (DUF1697 family)